MSQSFNKVIEIDPNFEQKKSQIIQSEKNITKTKSKQIPHTTKKKAPSKNIESPSKIVQNAINAYERQNKDPNSNQKIRLEIASKTEVKSNSSVALKASEKMIQSIAKFVTSKYKVGDDKISERKDDEVMEEKKMLKEIFQEVEKDLINN